MNKVKEIVTAWATSFNPTDEQKKLADERYSICQSCEHRKKSLGIERCNLCGCPLSKKIFTLNMQSDSCPDGRWKDVDREFIERNSKKRLL